MSSQPDLILQLAHHIARRLRRARGSARSRSASTRCVSLNGRRSAPLIDPDVDLGAAFTTASRRATWILAAPARAASAHPTRSDESLDVESRSSLALLAVVAAACSRAAQRSCRRAGQRRGAGCGRADGAGRGAGPAPDAAAPEPRRVRAAPSRPAPDPSRAAPIRRRAEPRPSSDRRRRRPDATPEPIEVIVVGTPLARTAGSAHVIREQAARALRVRRPARGARSRCPASTSRGEDGVGLRPNIGMRGVEPRPQQEGHADGGRRAVRAGAVLRAGRLLLPADDAHDAGARDQGARRDQLRPADGRRRDRLHHARRSPTRTAARLDLAVGEYGYGKAHGYFGTQRRARSASWSRACTSAATASRSCRAAPTPASTATSGWSRPRYALDPDARRQQRAAAQAHLLGRGLERDLPRPHRRRLPRRPATSATPRARSIG